MNASSQTKRFYAYTDITNALKHLKGSDIKDIISVFSNSSQIMTSAISLSLSQLSIQLNKAVTADLYVSVSSEQLQTVS